MLKLVPGLLFLVATIVVTSEGREPQTLSGLKFSHKLHVKDNGLACIDCHSSAPQSLFATDDLSARHDVCQTCHQDQLEKNCTYCHSSADTTSYVFERPVREIRFSHAAHVTDRKLECQSCHTDIAASEDAANLHTPAMAACGTCHDGAKATNACENCHTNFATLRPADHNRTDFIREHKRIARVSDATCMNCHTQESCTDCHNGVNLTKTGTSGGDLISPRSPRITAIDRGQPIVLMKIHDLNYRFTHGLDAEQKKVECQTCHDEQSFCTTCHQAGGDVNQGRFKPASHSTGMFVTIGVGSGGGEHAQMARRDIESCAACHDTQGGDPVCLTCHMDPDGIQGTNPRTHVPGFMLDVNGEWHSDPGAACYMCHTDANAHPGGVRGQKFCGYCHK